MDDPKLLDRETIERAFRLMGQYLLDRKTLGEIAIHGGSAILFQFDWRKASRDDARVPVNAATGLVIDAAANAATHYEAIRKISGDFPPAPVAWRG